MVASRQATGVGALRSRQFEEYCGNIRALSRSDSRQEIEAELERLLASEQFRATQRGRAFLKHIVEKALACEFDSLKERILGMDLFGRDCEFDTDRDSVVRVAANDVRRRLKDYYRAQPSSGVRISLRTGTYIPEIEILPASSVPPAALLAAGVAPSRLRRWLPAGKRFDPRGIKFPYINVAGYGQMGNNYSLDNRADDNQELTVNATRVLRNHTLRAGMNFRDYRENTGNFGQGSGTFTFGASWTNGPLDNTPAAPVGQSLAGFMLGLPTGGGLDINGTSAQRSAIWAGYIQDDWKVSPRLTLNFGLRYETESPTTERYDRTVLDFDFAATSPIEAAARANYAASPIAEIPVEAFRVKGGMRFAGVNGLSRGLFKRDTNNFMPRFGFAYQPGAKTVLRGGIGLFYQLIGIPRQQVRQTGFSKQTQFVASTDNGQTYIANLSNPFPDGVFDQPPGSSLGLMTEVGNSAVVFNPNLVSPYVTRWQFSVQREITRKTVVEVGYVGSKTVKLQANKQYNSTPQQYYSTSPVRDNAVINYISQQVNNPFYPLLPRTQMAGSRIARSQLVRPYPQFTSVTQDTNQGYSWYHSMQTRFERRFDGGLTANLSWTWSKLMEATGYLNGFDAMPYEVISDQDRTHRLTLNGIYELPFGPRKRFGGGAKGIARLLIGGWQVSYIYQAQSGAPIGFGNVLFYGDSSRIVLPDGERTISRWFNTAGFERDTARQLSWNVRTFPNRFSGLRADGMNNWDISLLKRTRLSERIASELRADFCNAMNHPQFSGPNTSPTSTAFGTITSEAQWPRTIQVSVKLVY